MVHVECTDLTLLVFLGQWHWLRIQYFFVPEAGIALKPTLVVGRANWLGCTVLGVLSVRAVVVGVLLPASAALHPRVALWETVLVGFWAAAERFREGTSIRMALLGVLGAVLVVVLMLLMVLVAVVVLGVVAGLTTRAVDVDVGLNMLATAAALIDVDVGVLLVAWWALAVALNPDVALGDTAGGIALDVDLTVDAVGVVLGCVTVDVDVDVRFLGLLLGRRLGPLGLLDGFQAGQVAKDLAETGVGDVELLLPVLELLLLAQQPVETVTHADATAGLDVAANALRMGRDVLEGAAHVAHGPVDPFRLLRVGFERVVDLADGQQATHFVEISAHAADDAHVDGVGWAYIAHAFGLVHELAQLVGAADGRGRSADGDELSFSHGGSGYRGSSRELCLRGGGRSMERVGGCRAADAWCEHPAQVISGCRGVEMVSITELQCLSQLGA